MAGNALASALEHPHEAEAALRSYEDWWMDKYSRQFSMAQIANEKMGRFTDSSWHAATGLLAGLSGDEIAAALRMDFDRRLACKLAWRGGMKGARFFLRRLFG